MSLTLPQILKKLESSPLFENFKKQNPEAYLCAGFFIINLKEATEEHSLDYLSGNMVFSFNLPLDSSLITMKKEEIFDKSKPLGKLDSKIKIQLRDFKDIAEKEFAKNNLNASFEKIIAVLHMQNSIPVWNLTCLCAGFIIVLIHINAKTGVIIKFEKRDLFDFVKPMKK